MPEYLGEEDLDAVLRQALDVGAAGPQGLRVADGYPRDALHGQHVDAAVVPVHRGNIEHVRALEVALQLGRIGSLAQQVQLVENGLLVLSYDLHRAQSPPLRPIAPRKLRQRKQYFQVPGDHLLNPGPQYLDHHLLTAG